jgi:serine/threonine protein phosphatase PrpC
MERGNHANGLDGSAEQAAAAGSHGEAGAKVAPAPQQAHFDVELPHFDFRIDVATASSTGSARECNQDVVLCRPEIALFGVADGLGGHAAGDVAARLAVDTVIAAASTATAHDTIARFAADPSVDHRRDVCDLLDSAVRDAHRAVREGGESDPNRRDMGTTLDVVLLVRDRAIVAHVGDSRVYLLRPTTHLQLTHDHKRYDGMRSSSGGTPPTSVPGPLSNSIGQQGELVVDILFAEMASGDRLLVGSDGTFSNIPGENRLYTPGELASVETCAARLIDDAQQSANHDDASIVVIDVTARVQPHDPSAGPYADDAKTVAHCPLFHGLGASQQVAVLAASVEVDLRPGAQVPRRVAGDRVAYLILDGSVTLDSGRILGPAGMLHAESLLNLTTRDALPTVAERARLLRIRLDDFNEICEYNRDLAAELYYRLARHLASNAV